MITNIVNQYKKKYFQGNRKRLFIQINFIITYLIVSQNSMTSHFPWQNADSQCLSQDEILIHGIQLKEVTPNEMQGRLHKNIVAIVAQINGLKISGTGLLISRNLVLTCAHNLCQKTTRNRAAPEQIQIHPGAESPLLKKPYKTQRYMLPHQYFSQQSSKYDYALLKLTEKVESNDFIPLNGNLRNKGQQFAIYGYPRLNITKPIQYGLKEKVRIKIINQQIRYQLSTQSGQSGSPIIQVVGNKMSVIGIHKGGLSSLSQNRGKLLSEQTLQILAFWTYELKGQIFKVTNNNQINQHPNKPIQKPINNFQTDKQKLSKEQQAKTQRLINALSMSPNSLQRLNELGNRYWEISSYQEAIDCFKKAIGINPNHSYPYSGMGNVLLAKKDVNGALANYRKATQLDPTNVWAQIGLGNAQKMQKNFSVAHKHFKNAIEIAEKKQNKQAIADSYKEYGIFLMERNKTTRQK